MGNEGVGGFLESIMGVMVVITASSVFLVMLSTGSVHFIDDQIDRSELLDSLQTQELWPKDDRVLDMGSLQTTSVDEILLPEGVHGVLLTYRLMGANDTLLILGHQPPSDRDVVAQRSPALLMVAGHSLSGVVEVQAW